MLALDKQPGHQHLEELGIPVAELPATSVFLTCTVELEQQPEDGTTLPGRPQVAHIIDGVVETVNQVAIWAGGPIDWGILKVIASGMAGGDGLFFEEPEPARTGVINWATWTETANLLPPTLAWRMELGWPADDEVLVPKAPKVQLEVPDFIPPVPKPRLIDQATPAKRDVMAGNTESVTPDITTPEKVGDTLLVSDKERKKAAVMAEVDRKFARLQLAIVIKEKYYKGPREDQLSGHKVLEILRQDDAYSSLLEDAQFVSSLIHMTPRNIKEFEKKMQARYFALLVADAEPYAQYFVTRLKSRELAEDLVGRIAKRFKLEDGVSEGLTDRILRGFDDEK